MKIDTIDISAPITYSSHSHFEFNRAKNSQEITPKNGLP